MPSDGVRTLVLLRHAKAERSRGADEARPLSAKGVEQVHTTADLLRSAGVVPDAVLVSPAVRTRQTWARLADRLGLDPALGRIRSELYEATAGDVVSAIAECGDARTVWVVGHEPAMSTTSDRLADDDSDSAAAAQVRVGLPTGASALLTSGDERDWQAIAAHGMTLRAVLRP